MVGVDEACDDGNDVALDGCLRDCREGPTGVTFTPGTVVGYQGASADNDDDQVCPAGEVLIGFRGQAQNVLTRLGSVCGSLVFDDGPAGLSVTISESMVFPELGPGGGGDFNALCPADHVVTGLAGRAGGSLDRLIVTCSALTVTDDLGTTFTLDLGDPIDLDPIGGGGGSAFGPTDCAPGEAVTAMSIGWGSDVDGFAFTCSELAFEGP
jgi:cysteine-rich repeat protein